MVEAGILTEDDRVELIDGELIPMTPIGPEHAACVDTLNRLLVGRTPTDIVVRIQNPVQMGPDLELYSDLALLRPNTDRYRHRTPGPQDVLLVIEVADTSLDRDRSEKLPRYARAGIPEVWVVDLPSQEILVYRRPSADQYQDSSIMSRTTQLSPSLLPDMTLTGQEIFA